MKKLFAAAQNLIRFILTFFKFKSTQRKTEKAQKALIEMINPELISNRDKSKLKANKEKIKGSQQNHFLAMVTTYRKKRLAAQQSGAKLYLGAKNKYGLREILNGKENAAGECELIINPGNVRKLKISHILTELNKQS